MDAKTAENIVKAEMASGSAVSKALLFLLQAAEVEAYRASARTSDPLAMARVCGKGESLHHFTKLITPVQASAPSGPPPM